MNGILNVTILNTLMNLNKQCSKKRKEYFLHTPHLFATLDDDLFRTRSGDNQVKTVSDRKADKEEHGADEIADELSRVILSIRFRRRRDTKINAIRSLLSGLFQERREQARVRPSQTLIELGSAMDSISVMPDVMRSHPFIAASYRNPSREDDQLEAEERAQQSTEVTVNGEHVHQLSSSSSDAEDRCRVVIIEDNPRLGPKLFHETKALRISVPQIGQNDQSPAVEVREHGTSTFSEVLRIMHVLPSSTTSELNRWIEVLKRCTHKAKILFIGNQDMLGSVCERIIKI